MLSDRERETLLDMERRLQAEDPGWVRAFDAVERRESHRRALAWTAHIVGLVLAVALFVLLVAVRDPGPALVCAAMAGLLIWRLRRLRRGFAGSPDADQPDVGPGADTGRSQT